MIVTLNFLRENLRSANGDSLPVGNGHVSSDEMTATGASDPAPNGTVLVRVATDTAIKGNFFGTGSIVYMPADSVEYYPARSAQTFTIEAA